MSNTQQTTAISPSWTDQRDRYIQTAVAQTEFATLEDGTVFASIPSLQGVWANEATRELCLAELPAVIVGWIMVRQQLHHPIPVL
ncbi:MAG: type II toxin-antitoxin system HicB family antitoxin [Chloroflexota bacterium]|nr:type II toxin-antitoxin system HicB family antitoxin [Chloroflexota bacterium]